MRRSRTLARTACCGFALTAVWLVASPPRWPITPSPRTATSPTRPLLVHDGRVYLYGSNDDDSVKADGSDDGYKMASFVAISSSDLKNWTDHGR